MFNKIKNFSYKPYLKQLQDVRVLGLLVFLVLVLLVSWSGVKVIQTNYELEQKISKLQQEVEVQELENANLKLRNEYYTTNEFQELAARRQFGLAAPGEKLVIIPKSVALAHTVDLPELIKKTEVIAIADKPKYQKNFEAWVNFFLNRQSSND